MNLSLLLGLMQRPQESFISICLFLPILGISIGIYPNLVLFLWNGEIDVIIFQIDLKVI